MILVYLKGLLKQSNIYEKAKRFEIIKSRKLRGNEDIQFSLKKKFSSNVNNPAKFLARIKL